MKICFLAPSQYGKSTAVNIMKKFFDVKNIKIAEPLYDLQKYFYNYLGIDVGDKQDGELLQFYGRKIRNVSEEFLLNIFKSKVENTDGYIITNDDCRPDDYLSLKNMGFKFIKIKGYKRNRDDIVEADTKNNLEWQNNIPFDYEVDNYGTIEEYENNLISLINSLLVPKCYIVPTQKYCNCDCSFCISKTRNYDKKEEFLIVNNKFVENIYTLKKHGIKKFEITGGGEPFLNSDLEEIILTIKRIIPDSYIKLYTNGNILKKINGIDELNISIVSNDIEVNNKYMNGNDIDLLTKLDFFKDSNTKLRLSVPLIKGAIDSKEKLDELIKMTNMYVDEYVVRTLYPNTKKIDEMYVDFDYSNEKVIIEKDNDVKEFNGLILWSDNKFYSNWNLLEEKYFYSYLLLKPDSKTYINQIDEMIVKNGFNVLKRYILNDFKDVVIKLYSDKDREYLMNINRHLESMSYLFGDNGMVYLLDKDVTLEQLYYETLKLKKDIRDKYSFTHAYGGYIFMSDNLSHVNLVHSPDISSKIYDNDINYLLKCNLKEIDEKVFKKVKKYRSYDL